MGYLIDTNILSELRKGNRMDTNVRTWFDSVPSEDIYLSTLVIGEIRHGIELLRHRVHRGPYVWRHGLMKFVKMPVAEFYL